MDEIKTKITKKTIMKKQHLNLLRLRYIANLMLVIFSLSCSKSSVDPNSPDYFIATVDGKEINFDNDIKAQINIPQQVSISDTYVFLIEANKVSGGAVNLYT